MGAGAVSYDRRLDGLFPLLARLPTRLPWHLAAPLGRESGAERARLLQWLQQRFAQVFAQSTPAQQAQWARAHLAMLAQEMVDAMAFHRLGAAGGPCVDLQGLAHVQALQARGQGFILVLNHFDRLLTAPVALARHGIVTHVLTMPVLDNPELQGPMRRFLMRKIEGYTRATGGTWRSTSEGLRPVLEGLRAGQAWVILADAWRPEFGRLRSHSFLGGNLQLPTGIERLAQSAGVPLLQAVTYTDTPAKLRVVVAPLPSQPGRAIDQAIARLQADVCERPWAWWHWGLWEQMWRPAAQEGENHGRD